MDKSKQTKYDVWASNLMLLSLLISIIHAYWTGIHMFDGERSWWSRGVYVFVYLFLANLYYYLRSGDKSIKTSFLVLIAVVALSMLPALQKGGGFVFRNEASDVLSVIEITLQVGGILLVLVSLVRDMRTAIPKED